MQRAVLYFRLFGQVVGVLNGRQHPLDSQERCQVGGVGRDDDQSEKPPDTADDTPWHRPVSTDDRPTARWELWVNRFFAGFSGNRSLRQNGH